MKRPFDIDLAISRIREAVRPFPKAALFELADEGFDTPFEQLVACIISIRTRDEVTLPTTRRFFARARTPAEACRLTSAEIDDLIGAASFHTAKAHQIHTIACRVVDEYGGSLPCDKAVLRSFTGVGPKCANLVLGIACNQPRIGVDVHVHRVSNRWGYVRTRTPEETTAALTAKLPVRYWLEINRLLVPFGNPNLTATQVRQILESTAVDLGTPGKDDYYGYGRVDAYAAALAAQLSLTPTPTPTPTPSPTPRRPRPRRPAQPHSDANADHGGTDWPHAGGSNGDHHPRQPGRCRRAWGCRWQYTASGGGPSCASAYECPDRGCRAPVHRDRIHQGI